MVLVVWVVWVCGSVWVAGAAAAAHQSVPALPPLPPQVRAPLPVRTERLYGDEPLPARPPPRRAANPVPLTVVDAFRDFR